MKKTTYKLDYPVVATKIANEMKEGEVFINSEFVEKFLGWKKISKVTILSFLGKNVKIIDSKQEIENLLDFMMEDYIRGDKLRISTAIKEIASYIYEKDIGFWLDTRKHGRVEKCSDFTEVSTRSMQDIGRLARTKMKERKGDLLKKRSPMAKKCVELSISGFKQIDNNVKFIGEQMDIIRKPLLNKRS